jgi:predicted secreted hydrolase
MMVLAAFLFVLGGCASDEDCNCDDDGQPTPDGDDDDNDDNDDNDNDTSPAVCTEGERRCSLDDVPEECQDGEWITLAPCPRLQYCNFGACLDTLVDLPLDESPHRDLIEWWYWTGNLTDDAGNLYGFELTYFFGGAIVGIPLWMINAAVTDETNGTHAVAVWFDYGWPDDTPAELHLASRDAFVDRGGEPIYELSAVAEGYQLDLQLEDLKDAAMHGGNGVVRMSSRTTDSFYYSRTRLAASGTLATGDGTAPVEGEAWMDHQWGNFLPCVLIGWDWYSLQFDDGSEVMFFVFRGDEDDPTVIDMALGTYIDANGDQIILSQDEVIADALDTWTSDVTGATYPQSWRFRVPGLGIDVDVTTEVPDQEMPNLMWTYWEGLVHIDGLKEGSPIGGLGFVELSGYAGRPFLWFLFPSVWGDSVIAD